MIGTGATIPPMTKLIQSPTPTSPRGHDLTLLDELAGLTPLERLERHTRFLHMVETLKASSRLRVPDPSDAPDGSAPAP